MNFPIYIPSKGRADLRTGTIDLLLSSGLDFKVVVEPQDFWAYAKRLGRRVIKLKQNNMGLAFSQQSIKELSKSNGEKWHWQLDDDIRSFYLRKPGGHEVLNPNDALGQIESEALGYKNIGQAGCNQNSWPPNYDKPIKVNGLPVQCVLNFNYTTAIYRIHPICMDLDYTLQVLTEGFCTLMFDFIRTNTPPISTLSGGCFQDYKKQDEIKLGFEKIVSHFPTMSIDRDEKGWHLRKNRIFSTFKQTPIPV